MTNESWESRLEEVYELMHEMSCQTEPQAMVRAYTKRIGHLLPSSRRISLSRRDMESPQFRITRYSEWDEEIDPWQSPEKLPVHSGGLFAELMYANRPVIIDELKLSQDDPAATYLEGQRSLMAIPMLDHGESLNMVISTQTVPSGFDRERFPDTFWMANLFGRATHSLVLKEQVRNALDMVDRELKVVSQIQQALLPHEMPPIPGFNLSAYYKTSQRAGGDYYDFFPLTDDQWGIFIADVSGHGTPAAVIMAITHSIAHLSPQETCCPGEMLEFVNRHLCDRYTSDIEAFVTAFYAIYDPHQRTLRYASAGHNPPRVWQCDQQKIIPLQDSLGFPLGISPEATYSIAEWQLHAGDRLVLYTDGITEAMNPAGEQFGTARLDQILHNSCTQGAKDLRKGIIAGVAEFTEEAPATDDRTLVVGHVR